MFRRLYWIVEQVANDGSARITGIYSSIQDLVHVGLKWSESSSGRVLRLTLVKPDTFDAPFGQWTADQTDQLTQDLEPFKASREYSEEEIKTLVHALEEFLAPV